VVIVIFGNDFKIVCKPDRFHLMVNELNRLPNKTKPVGVSDQTTDVDAHMFTL
jgi:hypothetical protein